MISYCYGTSKTDAHPQMFEAPNFDEFVSQILAFPRVRTREARTYICAPMRRNGSAALHRCKIDVLPRAWLGHDLDGGSREEVDLLLVRLSDYRAIAWETLRSTTECPRWRIVVLLDREVDRSEGKRLGAALVGVLGAGLDSLHWDHSTHLGEQMCYLPMAGAEIMEYFGDPVDVDSVLALAPEEPPRERPGRAEGVKVFEGGRNKHLFSKGCLMRYGGFDKEAILAALLVENQTTCSPALEKEEVEKIAASAARYVPGADAPPSSGAPEDVDSEHHGAAQNPLPPLAAQQRVLADLDALELHPRCVVQDYLYDDAGELIAPGGTGKTTLLLYEAIHIVLGMPLYGLKVVSPGPVVLLTAEDGADVLYARLREIMSGLGLSDEQKIKVLASVYIADLCGMDLRLACRKDGTIKPTALADHIIERYGPINPAVITIDPRVSFGVGEQQYSNDDAQALLTAARRIVRALQCCVRYIHHTGIQNAREWRLDQYSGRGASAMPDGCRMVAVMQPWFPETEVPLPPGVTHGPGESVMVLARAKGSYHEPWQPHIWITRRKWSFSHTVAGPTDKEAEAKACTDQIERYLIEKLKAGYRFTQNVLQDMGDVNTPRKALRDAVATLRATGRVVLAPLPEEERHGAKQTYLHPIKAGPPSIAPATAPPTAPGAGSAQLGKAPPSQVSAVHPTTAPEPHPPTGGVGAGGAIPPAPNPQPPEQLRRRNAAQCGAIGAVGGNDSAKDGASPHADNTDSDVEGGV